MTPINKIVAKFMKNELLNKPITVVGITGQAGAGKTYASEKIAGDFPIVNFDWFFRLSRTDRSRWLEEGKKISLEEWRRRADQNGWWDFEKARKVIRQVKHSGEKIILNNVYDREHNGELTGTHEITPTENGLLIIEGVPVVLLEDVDIFIYIHADDTIRKQRIINRDGNARLSVKAEERWSITQHFEIKIFLENFEKINCVVDNSGRNLRKMSLEDLEKYFKKQKEALPELRPLYY